MIWVLKYHIKLFTQSLEIKYWGNQMLIHFKSDYMFSKDCNI